MAEEPLRSEEQVKAAFKICRDEVKHEYDVLNGRLTSYITSQAFMVSAFAVSMNNTDIHWGHSYRFVFPFLLCFAGLFLSIQAYPGISSNCLIVELWHARQNELLDKYPSLVDYAVLHQPRVKVIYKRALSFAHGASYIFAVCWILFLGIVIYIGVFQ